MEWHFLRQFSTFVTVGWLAPGTKLVFPGIPMFVISLRQNQIWTLKLHCIYTCSKNFKHMGSFLQMVKQFSTICTHRVNKYIIIHCQFSSRVHAHVFNRPIQKCGNKKYILQPVLQTQLTPASILTKMFQFSSVLLSKSGHDCFIPYSFQSPDH